MKEDSRNCGNCDFWQENSLVKEIGKCFITNETKQAGAYCTKTDYFQIKKETPEGAKNKNPI